MQSHDRRASSHIDAPKPAPRQRPSALHFHLKLPHCKIDHALDTLELAGAYAKLILGTYAINHACTITGSRMGGLPDSTQRMWRVRFLEEDDRPIVVLGISPCHDTACAVAFEDTPLQLPIDA